MGPSGSVSDTKAAFARFGNVGCRRPVYFHPGLVGIFSCTCKIAVQHVDGADVMLIPASGIGNKGDAFLLLPLVVRLSVFHDGCSEEP
jgi:hypothetical protein